MKFTLSLVALIAFAASLVVETATPASALFGIHDGRHANHHHHRHHRRTHHATHRANR